MNKNAIGYLLKVIVGSLVLLAAMATAAFADIYINVMAVNGADSAKNTTIKFDLPGELTANDILDTDGLKLDYSVDDANFYVHGDVDLKPKQSKTFRIHVKDVWQITPDQVAAVKKQIEQGYDSLGKPHDAHNADLLKTKLLTKLDYIVNLQGNDADNIDKRISDYRTYSKAIKRLEDNALAVDYWRSNPAKDEKPKLIHMVIEVDNPTQDPKTYKHKDYLPAEVKPEDVVEDDGFEVRFDDQKQLSFLYKEDKLAPGQKEKYTIGILDIWTIPQASIDDLRSRATYAYGILKDSRFSDSAKELMDRISVRLKEVEDSQAIDRPVPEHISAFRVNQKTYNDARTDVETLEKLLAVYREDLEKSKVENILQKMQSLKGVADVSKTLFNKKFEQTTAWSFIGWILAFVGLITFLNFVIWLVRSKDKKIKEDKSKTE